MKDVIIIGNERNETNGSRNDCGTALGVMVMMVVGSGDGGGGGGDGGEK